ncbi:MAG: aminotransferase class V-fold PLP-dependent enzyme [Kutzneria sp.]|nr:aminotransferase class V-fold PLP-dependent enzyme [Kutzneria sp.]
MGRPGEVLDAAMRALGPAVLPELGIGTDQALSRIASVLVEHGMDPASPMAAAHLQPPPLAVAVAADTLASAANSSLDTYDSGPAGIAMERWVVHVLAGLAGLPAGADGVFTPGGSLSNLTALLLARDSTAARLGIDVRSDGVGALERPVVLCSELAHFSVHRACAALGLGEAAVRMVPVDGRRRMRVAAAEQLLAGGGTPIAIFATAGTTDFGSVDPLPELADLAADTGTWLHVDAAYGFGALFCDQLAAKVSGIRHADSITVDLHKIGWQPAAASALLVRDPTAFGALDRQVAYLNPADDVTAGYDGRLGMSLQTTRRADAVKVAATLLAHGRRGLGGMLQACHDLAVYAQHRITMDERLELVAPAELTTVVFRYRTRDPALANAVNAALRRRLMASGRALVGRTDVGVPASTCLKCTLLNPNATTVDIDALVDAVLDAGSTSEEALTTGACISAEATDNTADACISAEAADNRASAEAAS